MARAPAAKKSRPSESRSSSTTASSAKAGRKTAGDAPAEWDEHAQAEAKLQGWGVFECIDEKTLRIFLEVFEVTKRFSNSTFARTFVAEQSSRGDALASRAVRAVFRSKAGTPPRKKK